MRLDKVLYLCIVNLNILIMVQGKKQLSSKPKFAEVVIGVMRRRRCVSLSLSITRKGRTKRPLNVDVSLYLQGTSSLVNKSWDAEAVMN